MISLGSSVWLVAGCALLASRPAAQAADEVDGVTAVSSKVSADYVRSKNPDGSFKPELYAYGDGGKWPGEINDYSADKLSFRDVARIVAGPLSDRGYLPAKDPASTRLLIMVYWGTTAVPNVEYKTALANAQVLMDEYKRLLQSDPQTADGVLTAALTQLAITDRMRDRLDFKNAGMLGYGIEGMIGTDYGNNISHTALGRYRNDLVAEIEENRYFVVLMAYDFRLLWKEKKHKLLWETRFSISERRNQFDRALPVMARYASQYFGQDSNGLQRTRVPEGSVEVRAPSLIELLSGPKQ
jgi:hypothetical protein